MRLRVSFLIMFFMFATVAPQSAQAFSIWEFLFPTLKKEGAKPEQTLRAPFANEDAVIEDLDSDGNASEFIDLNTRHRTNLVMTRWIEQVVPKFVTYEGETYRDEFQKNITQFNAIGAKEYLTFLQDQNIIKTLQTGRYQVAGFVSNYPVIINEGPVSGHYRWLYQMDIMLTFLDGGADVYKNNNANDSISREYTLNMQIGRAEGADNEHGVLVETWSVTPKAANK